MHLEKNSWLSKRARQRVRQRQKVEHRISVFLLIVNEIEKNLQQIERILRFFCSYQYCNFWFAAKLCKSCTLFMFGCCSCCCCYPFISTNSKIADKWCKCNDETKKLCVSKLFEWKCRRKMNFYPTCPPAQAVFFLWNSRDKKHRQWARIHWAWFVFDGNSVHFNALQALQMTAKRA